MRYTARVSKPAAVVSTCVALALALASPSAHAQSGAPAWPRNPHPASSAAGEPLAYTRLYAAARSGEALLVAYTEAGEARTRGALRLARFRVNAGGGDPVLTREGEDRTVAAGAQAVALWWQGDAGALAYVLPRPHRGERPGARRRAGGPDGADRSLAEPLGASSLTAGDVMLQRLDAQGSPTGSAVSIFEDNAQASRVAVASLGAQGWLVAWTGSVSVDEEVRGTVRWSVVAPDGTARSFASDAPFTGVPGDVLQVSAHTAAMQALDEHPRARLTWTGQRCGFLEPGGSGPPQPPIETVAANDPRLLRPLPQRGPRARPGSRVYCEPVQAFVADTHDDGHTSAAIASAPLAADAVAATSEQLLLPVREQAGVVLGEYRPLSRPSSAMLLVGAGRVPAGAPSAAPSSEAEAAREALRTPRALSVGTAGATQLVASVAPRADRLALARLPAAPNSDAHAGVPAADTLGLYALPDPAHELTLAGNSSGPALLLVRTGSGHDGPLRAYPVTSEAAPRGLSHAPVAPPAEPDERLRTLVLRVREARAAYTALEASWGISMERPDPAHPPSQGLVATVRRTRSRWESACETLTAYARQQARAASDPSINDLARESCEFPPDPSAPPPDGAPVRAQP